MTTRLEPMLNTDLVIVGASVPDKAALLDLLAQRAHTLLPGCPIAGLRRELEEREDRHPTSTPEGVAFPHAMLAEIDQTLVIPVLLRPAVSFGVPTHPDVDLVFGIFGAADRPFSHVRLLARLARIVRGEGALERIRGCADAAAFHGVLLDEDRKHV